MSPPLRLTIAEGAFDLVGEPERLGGRVELHSADLSSPESVRANANGADAVVVTLQRMDSETIAALPDTVRIIGRAGIGLDTIDLDAARKRGIAVLHVPDYATDEVATHAVALLLAAHRGLAAADQVARGDWSQWRRIGEIRPIEESTVGVLGGGRIGSAVIDRLRPLAGQIIVHDPAITRAPAGAEVVNDFHEFLGRTDILTLHLPLLPQTRQIIDGAALKAMPAGAVVVNVSRGGLVHEQALADSLVDGHVRSAALDVFQSEPLPPESPLLTAPNLVLSPHIAWYSTSSADRLRRRTLDGVVEYLGGGPVRSARMVVDPAGSGR